MNKDEYLVDQPQGQQIATLVLAHGAGAGMDTPFMDAMAEGLVGGGIRVVRFEFPYMLRRRREGKRTAPDRPTVLIEAWKEVIRRLGGGSGLFMGGKSMGGRIASLVADEEGVQGLVCLGYPFHPPGNPLKLRTAHLEGLMTPTLIVQGERDVFGHAQEVPRYPLSTKIRVAWMPDGDHSWKPRKKSGHTQEQNIAKAVSEVVKFVAGPGE
ncbi:MAG: alpha/beta family hydrolase [Acidobacteriota bacterium]